MSTEAKSLAEELASLGSDNVASALQGLTDKQISALEHDWVFWGRPSQLPPTDADWNVWLILAGRGWGKTRTGSEWIKSCVCGSTPLTGGTYGRIAIVAETAADARDVLAEGPSGVLAVHHADFRPAYEPSKRRLVWPNGAIATLYNATEPDQLRGPQHDAAWCDELAKWAYARDTWDMMQFGLRMGNKPRQIVTTTPRPIAIIRELIARADVRVTRGTTFANQSNLAPSFLHQLHERYVGTRLGRQELNAELLDDLPGALWTRAMFEACRVKKEAVPKFVRVVVAVDPSGSDGKQQSEADSIGIVAAGLGEDGLVYVLADETCSLGPDGWGRRAVATAARYNADRIVCEKNFGGAMVEHVIRTVDKNASVKMVNASHGKVARAEPVAALYEQNKVRHVGGFPQLEDQMVLFSPTGYVGESSPDRADALVWAISDLKLANDFTGMLDFYRKRVTDQRQAGQPSAATA